MRPAWLIFFVLVAMSMLCAPLWARFGVVKTQARFAMYHPPVFHAYGHEIRLQVDSLDPRNGAMRAPRIQHQLEEGLARHGFRMTPNARTLLQCTLTDATALLDTAPRLESVNLRLGEHAEQEKDGTTKQVEDCKVQTLPVIYLLSSGHLVMQVKAQDTQTQTVVMSQMMERAYRQESAIAGPPRCQGATYGVARGQLQDPLAILDLLGDQVVNETLPSVTGYDEPREVLLAVDDPLKPGNAQAMAGDWQDALDTWTNASMRSQPGQAARQYNLGVAHEVLAAAAMRNWDLDKASSHLYESQESFAQALKLDSKEKYFRDTMARVEMNRQALQQQLEQASEEKSSAPGAEPRQPASAASSSPAVSLQGWPPGESGSVHDYWVYLRTRLSAQKGRPAEAFRQELLASAADYGVESDVALQVLDSETQRLALVRQNTEKYREDFQAAAVDAVITADERQMLRKRQQILHLTDEQTREIESQFKFQEAAR